MGGEAPNKPRRSSSFSLARAFRVGSFFGKSKTDGAEPVKTKAQLKQEEEDKKAALEVRRKEREAAIAAEEANVEIRYGMRINPKPAVKLKCPPNPPKLSDAEAKAQKEADARATAEIPKNVEKYAQIVKNVSLFCEMGHEELHMAAKALEVVSFRPGEMIYDEGTPGEEAWVLEEGTVISSVLIPGIAGAGWEWKETRPYKPGSSGSFFGERGLRRGEPRAMRMTCLTAVKALRITRNSFVACARVREYKENLLRGVQLFEQMTDDQIGKLASVIQMKKYAAGDTIFSTGDRGESFYLIESGETSTDPPRLFSTPRNFSAGQIFGEQALLDPDHVRESTVTAVNDVSAYSLSRFDFETQLDRLQTLQLQQLQADPRTLLAQFYQPGDHRGPAGTLAAKNMVADSSTSSKWFAVYRPCSRDSIAKMLGRVGVGKGLNIKGKSAQKNRLSGFVPFLQISNNDHKKEVEKSPKDARVKIFYKNVMAREEAIGALTKVMREAGADLDISVSQIFHISTHEPASFGLDVPEAVVREAYIMRPDLSPVVGWETGRPSVPQFMDMNLHGVRGNSSPKVVLLQHDLADPMNPHGLLIAYAEKDVKPVCSDFDTFTVGSKGIRYEALPPDQVSLVHWELDQCEHVCKEAEHESTGWNGHWLNVIGEAEAQGFHPSYPSAFGFGEATSTRFISDVVDATSLCGAVRHGAECFNLWFPQELDKEYLIVWDGFADPGWAPTEEGKKKVPWQSAKEAEVRAFLLERAREGFSFPLNPIWPVRDPGWIDVLRELQKQPETRDNLEKWFPPDSGIVKKIETLHAQFPGGFKPAPPGPSGPRKRDTPSKPPPPPQPAYNSLTD